MNAVAMIFAALESNRIGQHVKVQEFLEEAALEEAGAQKRSLTHIDLATGHRI